MGEFERLEDIMCPACVASAAAWVVGGTMSTSGITALAVRVLGNKKKRKPGDSIQRSKDHVSGNERTSHNQGGLAGRLAGERQ